MRKDLSGCPGSWFLLLGEPGGRLSFPSGGNGLVQRFKGRASELEPQLIDQVEELARLLKE